MKGNYIGELEELILLAVGSLYQEGAYAVAIVEVIKGSTRRLLDVTAVHAVLRRLEKKGYVQSTLSGATKERGGRRKRLFNLTQSGREVLDEVMSARMALYNKMPKLTFSLV